MWFVGFDSAGDQNIFVYWTFSYLCRNLSYSIVRYSLCHIRIIMALAQQITEDLF